MTPEAAKASLRRLISSGDAIVIQRGVGDNAVRTADPVMARFISYSPADLVGPISETDRKVVLSADDLIASGFPLPLRKTDRLLLGDRSYVIQSIDDTTRRVAGVLIAYELRVSGP